MPMVLKDQIKQAPIPYEAGLGLETAEICGIKDGLLFDLIVGTAGCSPYLRGLMQKETDWLAGIWDQKPDTVFRAILDDVGTEKLSSSLRCAKRRVALLTALCDLGGVWTLEQVTETLTDFADFAVHTALKSLVSAEITRGKLPDEATVNLSLIHI